MDGITLQEQHQQAVKELAPKPSLHNPEPYKVKEQPKEKKSRFGFFGKKRTNEDRIKEEAEEVDKKEKYQLEDKRAVEQQEEQEENEQKENQRARLKEEEKHKSDKERNLREDKDTKEQEENKVVYLTDEDIEDLLK